MFDALFQKISKHREKAIILFGALCILDAVIYAQIFALGKVNQDLAIHFLNVGQGDSQFVILPGGVKVLIDGGPANGKALSELASILPATDRYIDILIMSHPQADHFSGLIDVFKTYKIGAFLWSGREGMATSFADLKEAFKTNGAMSVIIGKGDRIKYKESSVLVLAPWKELMESKELNDTTVVLELMSKNSKTLFTGDIGANIENQLAAWKLGQVDILKVSHHGSKYSSSKLFIDAIKPKLSIIEVGKNSYGHPTDQTLSRLSGVGSSIYRTDNDKTVRVIIDGASMKVFKN